MIFEILLESQLNYHKNKLQILLIHEELGVFIFQSVCLKFWKYQLKHLLGVTVA